VNHKAKGGAALARFAASTRGNVAIIFALALPIVGLILGFGIDLSRHQGARNSAQNAVDAAILAAASSSAREVDALKAVVNTYLEANSDSGLKDVLPGYTITVTQLSTTQVKVSLSGSIQTYFGGLFGMGSMPINVESVAERGGADGVELVMVLDNTWSMSASAGGVSRINALKSSARILTEALMTEDVENVRIGIVPYAEYVNVGTANRSASWVSVPSDYSTTWNPPARVCTQVPVTQTTCTGGVLGTCTRLRDGIPETYSCWTTPPTCVTTPVSPPRTREQCTGGGNPVTTHYRWYGCVYSRHTGTLRLNNSRPDVAYRGFLGTSQNCLNPILTLTDQKQTVLNSINGLIINVGGYRPETHIPSGLIWGVNVLSPTQPFTEAQPYSEGNRAPRKILVLMTDGENTLRFNPGDGRHLTLSGNAATADAQKRATNKDTTDICIYAKSQGIEIFTVALSVNQATARTMLQNCASSANHYFDATDSQSLEQSFADIAASINAIRLVE